jgi:plasmid stabilization system protein ParE
MKIRFATEAIQDLQRLRAFVESKNPHAARRIAAELLDGIENWPFLQTWVSR